MRFDRNISVDDMKKKLFAEDPRTEVPTAFVDRRSCVHGLDIDFSIGCSDQYGGKDFSDPDLDDVLDDINVERPHDGNDHTPSVRHSSRVIVIRNDPEAHMSIIDPDAVHASEYPDKIPAHLMLVDP
ncbi:hypothetical protein GOBAR_DD10192 [Gossypium barbadense]|nr:hypothetical protein GOBAR_DD10192 [Gossypium barbadense]